MRPGSKIASKKLAACNAAGASAELWSGPASSSNTDVPGSSDTREASTAPAEPAPTTITSYTGLILSRRPASVLGHHAPGPPGD